MSVGVAVVGLGYWGPNLVRNLHELDGVEIKVVCDAAPEALARVKRRYPRVRATPRFQSVLSDPRVDAVAIATPVSTHFAMARACLEADKHVFVEKPLAGSAEEAEELIRLAEARSLVLMPGHTFLYSPPVLKVRDLIRSGALGEIYFISTSRVNLGLHQSDVSVAWDLAPHDFSILRFWLGEAPQWVSALSRCCIFPGIPDVVFANLEFSSGTIAHAELAWLAPSKLRRTTIVGSEKMVVYDDSSSESVRIFDSGVKLPDPGSFGEYQLSYRTGDIVSPPIGAVEPLQDEMADFRDSILEARTPRSSAQLGLEVVRMIEAVETSLRENGTRVAVGRGERRIAAHS